MAFALPRKIENRLNGQDWLSEYGCGGRGGSYLQVRRRIPAKTKWEGNDNSKDEKREKNLSEQVLTKIVCVL